MVFLPECFDFVGERSNTFSFAEACDGVTVPEYQKLARKHNIWLSLGGYHEKVCIHSEIYIYI